MKWTFDLTDEFVDRIERLSEKVRCFIPALITIQYLAKVKRDPFLPFYRHLIFGRLLLRTERLTTMRPMGFS